LLFCSPLSIYGPHMVIMAGIVFWLIRAGLALIPSIVLRYPIRKWAAAAALAAAFFYLPLSGAAVPNVRSWIMMSIVLIAVLLDRPALTMRKLAQAEGQGARLASSSPRSATW
jgi:competence protein ComEC